MIKNSEQELNSFFNDVINIIQQARTSIVKNTNLTIVHTYFKVGQMVVEQEQHGEKRAEYGKKIIDGLSESLTTRFGKGFSKRNVEQMRQFYLTYSIAQTPSAQLQKRNPMPEFKLG